MSTIRDLVSAIRASFKLLSSDDLASDRYIAHELIRTNYELVLRELNQRKGLNSPSLYTNLPCLEMEKIPLFSCCNINSDCYIAKSKKELPQIMDSSYNLVVQGVWSVDKKFRFKEIGNPDRYANYLNLPLSRSKERFFWIEGRHLYVTDPLIEKVSISAFFADPVDANMYSCDYKGGCKSNPLDLEFKSLPKIEDSIIKVVADKILKTYKRSTADTQEDDASNAQ